MHALKRDKKPFLNILSLLEACNFILIIPYKNATIITPIINEARIVWRA